MVAMGIDKLQSQSSRIKVFVLYGLRFAQLHHLELTFKYMNRVHYTVCDTTRSNLFCSKVVTLSSGTRSNVNRSAPVICVEAAKKASFLSTTEIRGKTDVDVCFCDSSNTPEKSLVVIKKSLYNPLLFSATAGRMWNVLYWGG